MLSPKLEGAFNQQIVEELYSSHLYLAMSAWFTSEHFHGMAKWMRIQAKEEHIHAMKFYDEILERGGEVNLGGIKAPKADWDTPLAAFELAYAHERKITMMIEGLVDLAEAEKDRAAAIFLQWFIKEQVEEEASTDDIVQTLRKIGASVGGVYALDHRLGKREG